MATVEPLSVELDRSSLKAASKKGVVVSYLSQAAKFIVQFFYSIVMARLLTPADFGVVAMATPLLALAALLADIGLSQAAVADQKLTQRQLSFLFWLNMGVTAALALLVVVLAPLVAMFYNEPRVAPVVAALGGLMILGPIGAQHIVLLNRNFAFGKLAIVELISLIAGAVAGIAAANEGFGIWSIILNQLMATGVTVVVLLSIVRWRPSAPKLGMAAEARHLLNFGANVATFNIFNFVARNIDNVLIGRAWGEVQLGVYNRAYSLLLLPLNQVMAPISRVALPLLSRIRTDPMTYRVAFWRMLDLALLLTFPASLFSLVTFQHLADVVLGPKWAAVGPIYGVLAIGALFAPVSHSANWLLMSQGRSRELRQYGIVSSFGFTAAIAAGLSAGPIGVASTYIGFGLVQGPIIWWLITRTGPVSAKDLFYGLAPYIIASVPVLLVLYALNSIMVADVWSLLLMLLLSYCAFPAIFALTPRGGRRLFELVRETRSLINELRAKHQG